MPDASLVRVLATALLSGDANAGSAFTRTAAALGREWRWLRPLARRFEDRFSAGLRPLHREVVAFLRADPGLRTALRRHRRHLEIARWLSDPQPMQPVEAARHWNLPAIQTAGDLAQWCGLTPAELDWFADLHDRNRRARDPRLSHYFYRVVPKRSGGERLIEIPKPRLRALQRRILAEILNRVPPHPSVHGFVRHRSIRGFAAHHTGQRVVLRMDLADFFPSISAARVQAMFRTAGYPETVAGLLTGLCTNAAPRLHTHPHLPQGAPTSPGLANICAWHMDRRLCSLAEASGAVYTRYADDRAPRAQRAEEGPMCVTA